MKVNRLSMYARGVAIVLNIPFSVAKRVVLWYQERHEVLPPLDQELTTGEILALMAVSGDDIKLSK